ncbi:hypothetical protein [Mariniflexile sp. AS56]|uniref:hypothetical protein n=1 Tax=Mariniflexile sp. AS56 TaxID=3063957 RepID=UPI0026EE55B3|nr:hypothetical protein [Mariniflexile sp. AS56]MDO7172886.1 hypothetical protein [Mariniflexile sp. AS56]
MKQTFSRRSFLSNTVLATTSIAFISIPSGVSALVTPESPFEGYNKYAEYKTDLRTSFSFGKEVIVNGIIYDSTGKTPVPNAKIEVWHLSPESTKYKHRGKILTDSERHYQFISNWPNRALGMQYRIYFKVSKNGSVYITELLFNNTRAHISSKHWETQNVLGDKKLFPKMNTGLYTSESNFNLSLNINQNI